jgi:hypothetical protein
VDETKVEEMKYTQETFNRRTYDISDPIFRGLREFIYDPDHGPANKQLIEMFMKEDECEDIYEFIQMQ